MKSVWKENLNLSEINNSIAVWLNILSVMFRFGSLNKHDQPTLIRGQKLDPKLHLIWNDSDCELRLCHLNWWAITCCCRQSSAGSSPPTQMSPYILAQHDTRHEWTPSARWPPAACQEAPAIHEKIWNVPIIYIDGSGLSFCIDFISIENLLSAGIIQATRWGLLRFWSTMLESNPEHGWHNR